MSYQAANDELEVIEADAWFDLYDAAPRVYANENGLRSHRFGQALCLVHENLISPEFARVVGATNAQQLSDAINNVVDNITLADLVDKQNSLTGNDYVI